MRHSKPREAFHHFLARRLHAIGLRFALTAFLGTSVFGSIAAADEIPATTKSPVGITGVVQSNAPARLTSEPTWTSIIIDRAWSLLLFEQHRLTQDMTGAVRDLRSTTSIASATTALAFVSFVYGILHAVGPGHGKAVISSYMLADKETLRRGILLAFLSSFIQALSAIALIGGLYLAAMATGIETRLAEARLETLSWGCVAILGAWLLLKQMWPMRAPAEIPAFGGADHPDHAAHFHNHDGSDHHHDDQPAKHSHHDHAEDCGCGANGIVEAAHIHDESCGHAHIPGPEQLAGHLSWRKAFALALSVGIRPCTGALLVIVFATSQGVIWAGILATFAMALGTAITVSALAALTVGSRNLAMTLAGSDSHWGATVAKAASITSAVTVFVVGSVSFVVSFHSTRPF